MSFYGTFRSGADLQEIHQAIAIRGSVVKVLFIKGDLGESQDNNVAKATSQTPLKSHGSTKRLLTNRRTPCKTLQPNRKSYYPPLARSIPPSDRWISRGDIQRRKPLPNSMMNSISIGGANLSLGNSPGQLRGLAGGS